MKWIALLCLLHGVTQAQTQSMSLAEALDALAVRGIQVFYSSDYLTEQILAQTLSDPLDDVMALAPVLARHDLVLRSADGGLYVITPLARAESPLGGLVGRVSDANSGAHLETFSVRVNAGEALSQRGHLYLADLSPGAVSVRIDAPGHYPETLRFEARAGAFIQRDVALQPLPLKLEDIRVSASHIGLAHRQQISQKVLLRDAIQSSAPLVDDPLRSLQQLPGISGNGIGARVHTRGGKEDESLVLLDGMVIREPYHFRDFFGLFSSLNMDAVDSIDLYSGVFPVRYGGRMSGVISAESSAPAAAREHSLGLNILNAGYTHSGHSRDFDHDWLVAVRSGGFLFSTGVYENDAVVPEYEDGYFKYRRNGETWQTSAHLLVLRDEIGVETDDEMASASYQNQNFWVRASGEMLGGEVDLTASLSRSHRVRSGAIDVEDGTAVLNDDVIARQVAVNGEYRRDLTEHLQWSAGFELAHENADVSVQRARDFTGPLAELLGNDAFSERHLNFDRRGDGQVIYSNLRVRWNDRWITDLGFRWGHKSWIDDSPLSPRLSISYFPGERSAHRFAIGRHQQWQHLDELLFEDADPEYFKPASAELAVYEYDRELRNRWHLRAEVYYKKYSRVHPYYENLFSELHVLPELFVDRLRITPDDAAAMGAEVTLRGTRGALDWSIAYAFSDADDYFDDVEQPRSWDQHSSLKWHLGYAWSQWRLDLSMIHHQGWPRTLLSVDENDPTQLLLAERNAAVYRDFNSVDARFGRRFTTARGEIELWFQLNNALDRDNACCVEYDVTRAPDGTLQIEEDIESWLPLIPGIGVRYTWR